MTSVICGKCGGKVCMDMDEGDLIDLSCLSCGKRKTYEKGEVSLKRLERQLNVQA